MPAVLLQISSFSVLTHLEPCLSDLYCGCHTVCILVSICTMQPSRAWFTSVGMFIWLLLPASKHCQNVTSQHLSKMTTKPLKTHYLTPLKSNQSSNWTKGKFLHLCVMTHFNGHFPTLSLITVSRSRLPTTP